MHSAKSLPSAALGKGFPKSPHGKKKVSAKAALSSAFYRTLGKPDTKKSSK
jgi:hypothetical protein